MASKFQKRLQAQQKTSAAPSAMPQVATSVAVRSAPAPAGNADASRLRSEISRPAMEPSGQIVRVRADEIYEVEQVRPEEDFDEDILSGMVDSLSEFGNLTPPRCFPRDRKGYRVWFGATRVRSMKRRGDEFIDIYVGAPPRDERQRIMGQLIENLQQSGLKPLATAMAFERLKSEFGMSGEEIAKSLGKPTAFVSKHMRIGAAPEKIRFLVSGKKLSDVELIYNLIQLNETDSQCADELIGKIINGQTVTRAQVKKELTRLKRPEAEPRKQPVPAEISHAKFSESAAVSSESTSTQLSAIVSVNGLEGTLLLDETPDEYGWVWVSTSQGKIYVEAREVKLLGLK
ncbi:ParB/RepB/Spo0J family partition protein [Pantoea piersonii]|uniref:ParB/RepB/Spo0J family partition protein n=1 Tax=Pantoea piersonii TaxID=2364647 RepID=UPI0028976F39|nr:ParB/RepB/Spo0J family partition protein [Pantoea piersonii]MDU6438541.1 ParB/RepB/Spo0J family partition protein [Pantoea sp.]